MVAKHNTLLLLQKGKVEYTLGNTLRYLFDPIR